LRQNLIIDLVTTSVELRMDMQIGAVIRGVVLNPHLGAWAKAIDLHCSSLRGGERERTGNSSKSKVWTGEFGTVKMILYLAGCLAVDVAGIVCLGVTAGAVTEGKSEFISILSRCSRYW